mgnify:CR=1 FL=1
MFNDNSLADFPRLNGENNDSPRFKRAIAATPSGVLYVPGGIYEIAEPLEITNLCSLELQACAILRAVKEMDFILRIDNRLQWDKKLRTPDMPQNYNLFLRGGQFDGNGLASCVSICHSHHFTLSDSTMLNGKKAGLSVDDGQRFGYEMIVTNLYCKTVIPGLAGNVGVDIYGGDSHYTDVVVVDYTIGMRLTEHAWANRLTRCHVWGGPIPPPAEGELPEMLKDSICFDIHQNGNILRDCYADTGAIGFLIDSGTQMSGCYYYSNPVFNLDNITCIKHVSGTLSVMECTFTKTAEHVKIYEGSGENLTWCCCNANCFEKDEIPFESGESKVNKFS